MSSTALHHPALTTIDIQRLHQVITAAHDNTNVHWVSEFSDDMRRGTARSISPFNGVEHTDPHDIRDQYLHISSTTEL